MSWLDATSIPEQKSQHLPPNAKIPREPPKEIAAEEDEELAADSDTDPEVLNDIEVNPAAAARARYPHGWLVVVEGPGIGEWFVLERGVSHIGSADGQTVCLNFGDNSVAPVRHAELSYNQELHVFELQHTGRNAVRLNGTAPKFPVKLRDGDIISVGETSLRLVGLCTPNFNWG